MGEASSPANPHLLRVAVAGAGTPWSSARVPTGARRWAPKNQESAFGRAVRCFSLATIMIDSHHQSLRPGAFQVTCAARRRRRQAIGSLPVAVGQRVQPCQGSSR